jgi:tetratricopeptide (TPR) repeat protein
LWLCGRDNVVFAPNSPFVEAAEAFLRKSKELLKTKKYDEAYGEVKKSSDILPQWKEQQLFEKKIRNKIRGQYVWGGVLGGTIFPVVGNILGFAIGEVFNKVFFLKIKVAKKRFLRPFYTSVVINSFLLSLFIFGMYKSPGFNNFVHMILGAVQHNAQTSEKNIALANKENKLAETQLTLLEKELSEIVARDKIDEQTVVTISEIVKLKKELYGTNSDVTAERIGLLGIVYRRLGRYEEAEKPSEDAMKIIEANHPGVENPGLGPLYCNLAIIKYELKKFPEAKEYAQKATKAFEALGQSDGIETKRMRKILDEIKKKRK